MTANFSPLAMPLQSYIYSWACEYVSVGLCKCFHRPMNIYSPKKVKILGDFDGYFGLFV